MEQTYLLKRITRRFSKYVIVGVFTYLLDLGIVAFLTYTAGVHYSIAVAIGFLIGVSVNYQISYHWVFKGTEQNKLKGYIIFGCIALLGMAFITLSTTLLVEYVHVPLLLARTLIAGVVGISGFLINSKYNFKMM